MNNNKQIYFLTCIEKHTYYCELNVHEYVKQKVLGNPIKCPININNKLIKKVMGKIKGDEHIDVNCTKHIKYEFKTRCELFDDHRDMKSDTLTTYRLD